MGAGTRPPLLRSGRRTSQERAEMILDSHGDRCLDPNPAMGHGSGSEGQREGGLRERRSSATSPNPAIGYWSGSERLMNGSFRGRRSSPAKGFGLPPTPDLIRGRKPQRWGGAPAGFARGAGPRRARRRFGRLGLRIGGGSPWPSPSKSQCLPLVNLNHSRSHPHFNRGIWEGIVASREAASLPRALDRTAGDGAAGTAEGPRGRRAVHAAAITAAAGAAVVVASACSRRRGELEIGER